MKLFKKHFLKKKKKLASFNNFQTKLKHIVNFRLQQKTNTLHAIFLISRSRLVKSKYTYNHVVVNMSLKYTFQFRKSLHKICA